MPPKEGRRGIEEPVAAFGHTAFEADQEACREDLGSVQATRHGC
jgi:hypothetical protein